MREDFLGNDQATKVTEVGTYRCRALHSNHMQGHVWQESPPRRCAPVRRREREGTGRRRPRLLPQHLAVVGRAHAPFMHNNAVGRVCGAPSNKANDFYRSPVRRRRRPHAARGQGAGLLAYDPSVDRPLQAVRRVDGRPPQSRRAAAEARALQRRRHHSARPRLWDGKEERQVVGFTLVIPPAPPRRHGELPAQALRRRSRASPSSSPTPSTRALRSSLDPRKASSSPRTCAASRRDAVKDPSRLVDAVKARRAC